MNKQQNKQKLWTTHIYIHISCKCDTNRAGHFTLDAHASRPVACWMYFLHFFWWRLHNQCNLWKCPLLIYKIVVFQIGMLSSACWLENLQRVKKNDTFRQTVIIGYYAIEIVCVDDAKIGVEIRYFPHFCSNIGVLYKFSGDLKSVVEMAEHIVSILPGTHHRNIIKQW